jgi:hypothetical protein
VQTAAFVSLAECVPCAGWESMLGEAGFKDIEMGVAVDTFGGARGEGNAREFDVQGFPFLARKAG